MPPEQAVIASALDLFWQKGYADTSMAEIVAATGLNRYAIYSTFGSKRELFLAALDAYFVEGCQRFEPVILDQSTPAIDRLRQSMVLSIEMMDQKPNGCFMCHVAVELAAEDPKIAEAVSSYFTRIVDMIEIMMRDLAEEEHLNPNLSPRQAAQLVFDTKLSMGVHGKAGTGRDRLEAIAATMIAAVSTPSQTARVQ